MKYIFPTLCLASLLAGCVVEPYPRYRIREVRPAGLSNEEIVRMSKAGISETIILERIKTDGIVARPSSDQIVALKNEGLSEPVLAAMLDARVEPAERVVESVYYPYDYYSPYSYGYPYYGYPYSYGYWGYYPYGYGYGWYSSAWRHGCYSHYGGTYPGYSYSVGHYRH